MCQDYILPLKFSIFQYTFGWASTDHLECAEDFFFGRQLQGIATDIKYVESTPAAKWSL